jgi:hypothetical protein
MSIYYVNKIAYLVTRDPEFLEALLRDPAAVLAKFPLTDEERQLMLAGEVGRLYEMGGIEYLLGHLATMGAFGLTVETYSARMRAAKLVLP